MRCDGALCAPQVACCLSCASGRCGACDGGGLDVACDGPEDCSPGNACCFSLAGASCTPTSACTVTIPQPDAGPLDAGVVATLLDQGLRACNRTLDCRIIAGEMCCSSPRITRLDIGLCVPFWICT